MPICPSCPPCADVCPQAAAKCMVRLAKMSARYMGNRGMSIGIEDVTPKPKLSYTKEEILAKGYADVAQKIALYNKGQLQLAPGCNLEQTLEAEITGILNNIREIAGERGARATQS